MTVEQFMDKLCKIDPDAAVDAFVTSGYFREYASKHPESLEKILLIFNNVEFKRKALAKDPQILQNLLERNI